MSGRGNLTPCYRSGADVDVGTKLWSSDETDWAGFRLETRRLNERVQVIDAMQPFNQICACTGGYAEMEVRTIKGEQRAISSAGAVVVANRGVDFSSFSWSGATDILTVDLDSGGPDIRHPSRTVRPWGHHFLIHDEQLYALLITMFTEAKGGCTAGSLYAQCLSTALAAYVDARFTTGSPAEGPRARLTTAQRERIRNYVQCNLAKNIRLQDLADLTNLSVSHFSTAFRQSFDCPPHQYLVRERVREAQALLTAGRMSIVEIAAVTGFADQSHFTSTFKRFTNTTPRQFQSAA